VTDRERVEAGSPWRRAPRGRHRALAGTTGAERKLAVDALADCAVRATRWRLVAHVAPATVAFPGTTS
jgi:hypothetical protein